MDRLADNDLVHDYAPLGTSHWFVNPDTQDIYLNAWEVLRSIEDGEKDYLVNEVKSLLELTSLSKIAR